MPGVATSPVNATSRNTANPARYPSLAAARRVEPDAVVVDLMMESVDAGSRLSQALKAQGYGGPIYLLSSAGESVRFNIDAREMGLAGIFQKPVDHGVLVRTLKKTLRVN